tara:strand:+ start:437 stop:844 length:408 start_codon:yes stop_codon:yes gene_type:complete
MIFLNCILFFIKKRGLMYEIAAKLTLLIHLVFIVFVGFGAFIYFVNSNLLYLHFLSLIWGSYAILTKTICPLTYLENWLLKKAGLDFYSDGFIQQYIFKIVYPAPLSDGVRLFLIIFVIFTNFLFYLIILKKIRK